MMLRHDREATPGCLILIAATFAFFTMAGVHFVATTIVEWLLGL